MTSPSARLRRLLRSEDGLTKDVPGLFVQMDELVELSTTTGLTEWQESARWVRYEESVEGQGERWSKPYVSSLLFHALMELRHSLLNGALLLDCTTVDKADIADRAAEAMGEKYQLTEMQKNSIRDAINKPHRPQKMRKDLNRKQQALDALLARAQQAKGEEVPTSPVFDRRYSVTPTKLNKRFRRKVPVGAHAAHVLVAKIDKLPSPMVCLMRMEDPVLLEGVTEVSLATKYMFLVLGPPQEAYEDQYKEIGRCMATLLCDEVFRFVVHRARTVDDILTGLDEFLDAVTLLAPANWTRSGRIDPPALRPVKRAKDLEELKRPSICEYEGEGEDSESDGETEDKSSLQRTGRLFGGLVNDVKRRAPFYLSDYRDALHPQCIASFIFLYFAAFTPIVTFGALLGHATHHYMASMECILAGAICGITFHVFSGQPLNVLGPTGPMLVLEFIVYQFAHDYGLYYLSFRLWIGLWCSVMLILLTAFDLSALVAYITRFTEEAFACLISTIFIYDAFKKLIDIWNKAKSNSEKGLFLQCFCTPPTTNVSFGDGNESLSFTPNLTTAASTTLGKYLNDSGVSSGDDEKWTAMSVAECIENFGILVGRDCAKVTGGHEIFYLSALLFIGTFAISTALHKFRGSSFFPSKIRSVLSDFCVFIAIVVVSGVDAIIGLDTPKLAAPSTFDPTHPDRGWLVSPMTNLVWWAPLVAVPFAMLTAILIFMDQQITAVIVNRKENKMKKGAGYHMDLLIVAVLIIVCSVFGLPWYVASTVVAITHVTSLKKESECTAPGDVPQFIGVREQRLTGILAHLLIGLSVFLTPLLRYVPMPVLYGVFLYMGVSSLYGLELVDRILLLFMPPKYQPDLRYLRKVPTRRVHLFTLIQLGSLALLWVIKKIKVISIAFPLMVLALCFVRNVVLERIFSEGELRMLDHLLPNRKQKITDPEGRPDSRQKKRVNGKQQELEPILNGHTQDKETKLLKIDITAEVNKNGVWTQMLDNSKDAEPTSKETSIAEDKAKKTT